MFSEPLKEETQRASFIEVIELESLETWKYWTKWVVWPKIRWRVGSPLVDWRKRNGERLESGTHG